MKYENGVLIAFLVYVDDIVIIEKFKLFLKSKIKILEGYNIFFGIKALSNKQGICMSQRKYCLKLLNDYGLLGYKPENKPI